MNITQHFPLFLGSQADQGRATTLQRGGRNVKRASASQHSSLLWFMGVCAAWKKMHCTGHRAHDIGNPQNVCIKSVTYTFNIVLSSCNCDWGFHFIFGVKKPHECLWLTSKLIMPKYIFWMSWHLLIILWILVFTESI